MPKIQINKVNKHYATGGSNVVALSDINLAICANEFVTIVGASGCGKSTLLRSIGGLDDLSSGESRVDAQLITAPGANRAMVFQNYSLYPWLTVRENIQFSQGLQSSHESNRDFTSATEALQRVDALIDLTGLRLVEHAYPNQLSGGSIQASMSTYDQVISSNANGQNFKVVMPVDFSNGADAIVAENSIKTIADLKGKKVAYPFSSIDNLLVVFALNKVGLKETDIQSIDTTPENVPSALLGGALAGATYEPTISKILKMGNGKKYHVLMTSKEAPGLLTDVLYMDKAYIDKNPGTIRAVMKGYLDGLQYIKDKPVAARKIIAKYLSATEAEVKEQQAGVYNIPAAEMAGYFMKRNDSKSLYKTADLVNTILIARGQIKTPTRAEGTLDNRFALELQNKNVAKK